MRCNRRPSSHPQSKAGGVWIAALAWHCRGEQTETVRSGAGLICQNAKTYRCFNKDTVHSVFACCQTAAVSKHVTECVVLTRGIFQIFFILLFLVFFFLQQCLHVCGGSGAKNKLERSFFPMHSNIYISIVLSAKRCILF